MPYKSDKQRRYMHAKHPEIAARWDKETGGKVAARKPVKKAATKKVAAKKGNPFAEKAKEMAKDKAKKKAAPYRKATKKK